MSSRPQLLRYALAAALGAVAVLLVTNRIARREPAAPPTAPAPRVAPAVPAPVSPDAATVDRLTKENADLQAQLEAARARLTEHDAALKQTKEQLAELRRPLDADILSSTLRAELKSGEVVVTGGYRLPDGKRLYAFAQPVVEQVEGQDMIKIQGRYLSVTDDAGKAVGLDSLATNAANTLQHGEVWVPAEEASVFSQLNGAPGTDIVSYPSLTMRPGASGTISVGDIQLKVTPTLAPEGNGLGLELRLEQPQTPPTAENQPAR